MSPPKSKTTDWFNLLRDNMSNSEVKPVGKGWYTSKEIAKLWGTGKVKTHTTLSALLKKGKVDRFNGRCLNERGRNVQNCWYRIKK